MITLNTGEVIAGQYTADSGGHTAINIALNADGTLRRPPTLVMESDSTPVTPGGDTPGWVSGSIASLAASVQVWITFYLGPQWDQYGGVTVGAIGNALSTGGGMSLYGSDDGTTNATRLIHTVINSVQWTDLGNGAANEKVVHVRPAGRFVRAQWTNGATAQPAAARLRLIAFPS